MSRNVAAILFSLSLLLGTGCSHSKTDQSAAPSGQTASRAGSDIPTAKGLVESEESAELSSRVPGTITAILVSEGQPVHKGEVLVRFEDGKIRAKLREAQAHYTQLKNGARIEDRRRQEGEVARAQATYDQAEQDYQRQKKLYETDATTLNHLQKAEEALKVAKAQLEEAQQELARLANGSRKEEVEEAAAQVDYDEAVLRDYTLVSPMNGVVADKTKNSGETVDAGTPVLKVIDPDKLRIRAELEESDAGKVRLGEAVEVFADVDKEMSKPFQGTVTKVFPVLKRKTLRSFDPMASSDVSVQNIYVKLKDYSGLKYGMTTVVRFSR